MKLHSVKQWYTFLWLSRAHGQPLMLNADRDPSCPFNGQWMSFCLNAVSSMRILISCDAHLYQFRGPYLGIDLMHTRCMKYAATVILFRVCYGKIPEYPKMWQHFFCVSHRYIIEIPNPLYRHVAQVPPIYALWRLKSCTFGKPDNCRYRTVVERAQYNMPVLCGATLLQRGVLRVINERRCVYTLNAFLAMINGRRSALPMNAEGTLFCTSWTTTMAAKFGISIIYLWRIHKSCPDYHGSFYINCFVMHLESYLNNNISWMFI